MQHYVIKFVSDLRQLYRGGSVLLMEETGENHRPAVSHRQILSHNVVSSTPRHEGCSKSQL
jgi:hypothetical protein